MTRRSSRWTLVPILAAAVVACGQPAVPGSPSTGASGPDTAVDRLHVQARAALDRWAAAKGAAGQQIAIVGELIGQIGDWELAVGDNNKSALMAGLVRVAGDLPTETPPPGEVRWADGTTASVTLLSATDAVDAIRSSAVDQACDTCRVLEVTSARLVDGPVETSRGDATVPIWQFTLQGTRVIITRVAIAAPVAAEPPPWDPMNPPEGISIEGAVGRPGDRRLVVSFVGAPDPAARPCGADYTAEAVESDVAIVVIVSEHPHGPGESCSAVGATRTATVELARPLGDRAILEVKEGLPVRLMTP
jgi:hypothetical protein